MLYSSVDTIWVPLGAALVFFMQAGFAMVETGFTRAKNAGNIVMKNLMDFCLRTPTSGLSASASCSGRETAFSYCASILIVFQIM
jgi:Amt family ammonium transporter